MQAQSTSQGDAAFAGGSKVTPAGRAMTEGTDPEKGPGHGAPDLEGLAAFIRAWRTQLGLTQEQLAERLIWEQKRVSNLENAKYGLPSLPLLARLADALRVPLSDVLRALGYEVSDSPAVRQAQVRSSHAAALLYCLERLLDLKEIEFPEALDRGAPIVAEAMGADVVVAYVHNRRSRSLVAAAVNGLVGTERLEALGLHCLPLDSAYRSVAVFETGEPYMTGHGERADEMAATSREGLTARSVLVARIEARGIPLGVLSAGSIHSDRFSQEDRDFFVAVAHWMGLMADHDRTPLARLDR